MERRLEGLKLPIDGWNGHRWPGLMFMFMGLLCAASILGCGDQDAGWRATRDAVGAREGDESVEQQRWRGYRQEVIVSLDEMRTVLEGSPGTQTVVDQREAESLLERIAVLRDRLVREASMPPERAAEERPELIDAFEAMRSDVDAFLLRLGHDPADMAYWQDIEGSG